VTADFNRNEYLQLQEVVHRVGEAIRQVVPTERLYLLSLGSQQAARPLACGSAPPDVPFEQQQLAALNTDLCLDLSEDEFADLAERLRREMR